MSSLKFLRDYFLYVRADGVYTNDGTDVGGTLAFVASWSLDEPDVTTLSRITSTEFEQDYMITNAVISDGLRKIIDRPLQGNPEGKFYRKRFQKKGVTR